MVNRAYSLLSRRRPTQLLLDAVFAVWVLHVIATGSLVPAPIADLLSNETPIAVVTDPVDGPEISPDIAENPRPSL
jgi:hypothetical protein